MARGRKPWNLRESTSKICMWCGKEFQRPSRMGDIQWGKYKCCSRPCGRKYANHKMTEAEFNLLIPEFKICEICGKRIVRRPGEVIWNWRRRRTCGRGCAGKFKAGKPQKKRAPRPPAPTPEQAAGVVTYRAGDSKFEELRRLYEGRQSVQARGCRV